MPPKNKYKPPKIKYTPRDPSALDIASLPHISMDLDAWKRALDVPSYFDEDDVIDAFEQMYPRTGVIERKVSADLKSQAWEKHCATHALLDDKGRVVGKPGMFATDRLGNVMFRDAPVNSLLAWDVEYIMANARGGKAEIGNLSPINADLLKEKGSTPLAFVTDGQYGITRKLFLKIIEQSGMHRELHLGMLGVPVSFVFGKYMPVPISNPHLRMIDQKRPDLTDEEVRKRLLEVHENLVLFPDEEYAGTMQAAAYRVPDIRSFANGTAVIIHMVLDYMRTTRGEAYLKTAPIAEILGTMYEHISTVAKITTIAKWMYGDAEGEKLRKELPEVKWDHVLTGLTDSDVSILHIKVSGYRLGGWRKV